MCAEYYQIHEIGQRCWRIDEDWTRFFLFEGEKKALLVDTGFGKGDLHALVEGLTDRPVMVVNTHASTITNPMQEKEGLLLRYGKEIISILAAAALR